jgi:ABC-type amino acid transport substrate-binding protein
MIFLTNKEYAALVAEGAVAAHYKQQAEDAEARYAAIVNRALAEPTPRVEVPAFPSVAELPQKVRDALDEFRSDGELYAYNTRWATSALAGGQAPESVAHMIRYGQAADDYAAVLS